MNNSVDSFKTVNVTYESYAQVEKKCVVKIGSKIIES